MPLPVDSSLLAAAATGGWLVTALRARRPRRSRAAAPPTAAETRLAALMEHAPAVVVIKDLDGRYLSVSKRFADQFGGCTPDQLVGRSAFDLMPASVAEALVANDQEAIRTREPVEREEVVVSDGQQLTFFTVKFPLFDEAGEVVAVAGISTDVTERKQIEQALHDSEVRFREVFDHGPLGQLVLTPDGRITQVNPALCRMLGFQPLELVGGSVHEFVHPVERALSQLALAAALEGVAPIPLDASTAERGLELRLLRRGGAVVWAKVSYSVVRSDDESPSYVVGLLENVSARRRAEDELEHRALHDGLTGLPNRSLLAIRLQEALDGLVHDDRHQGNRTGVLFIDLDGFKEVNDTLGHDAGDELLRVVAVRFQRTLRPDDTLARFGGDEFVVCCPGLTDEAAARAVAERLLSSLTTPVRIQDATVPIAASIGVAISAAGSGTTPSDLLRDADVALYAAKDAGRNRAVVFDPGLREETEQRRRLEAELVQALERDELELRYQLLVDAATAVPVGAEALVRWAHPTEGLLAPDRFLEAAERCGLAPALDAWVIQRACRDAASWPALPSGDLPSVAINLSPSRLADAAVVGLVREACESSGLDPRRITIELTETALVEQPAMTAAVLDQLRALGARVALDDFGTGYSSLSHLRELPVDQVKIDRSFIRSLPDSDRDGAIVAATVGVARALGADVVAEGIETEQQWRAARAAGCSVVQGFYFARPARCVDLWVTPAIPLQPPPPGIEQALRVVPRSS